MVTSSPAAAAITDGAPRAHGYRVLARRTRPQSLGELVGQQVLCTALGRMLDTQKIPHAFLFTGTRGIGKTSTARILAKSLNCEKGPTVTPCQTCIHCTEITQSVYEDVVEIDAASHTGVDSIRELQESTRFFPVKGRYKIYIIDEVHMLSQGAFNALLKTLEEPPAQVIFLLATTELHKVPVTVRSRCLVFALRKVGVDVLAAHLGQLLHAEGVTFEEQALKVLAREAKGSVRDALSLLEQVLAMESSGHLTFEGVTRGLNLFSGELALTLFEAIVQKDVPVALGCLERADAMGLDAGLLVEECARYFFATTVHHASGAPTGDAILGTSSGVAGVLGDFLPHEIAKIKVVAGKLSRAAATELFRYLISQAREAARMPSAFHWLQLSVLDAMNRSEWLSAGELLGILQQGSLHFETTKTPSLSEPVRSSVQVQGPSVSLATPAPGASVVAAAVSQAAVVPAAPLVAFRKVLGSLQTSHPALYARLLHAQIQVFSDTELVFMTTPENDIYARLSPEDEQVLQGALVQAGYPKVRITPLHGSQVTNAPTPRSLVELKKAETKQALEERERITKANPAVQNLLKVARSVKFAPIDEDPSS